jgi:hypothetical protein
MTKGTTSFFVLLFIALMSVTHGNSGMSVEGGTIRIDTTPEQERAMVQAIYARLYKPGNYNLTGRNCSLFTGEILRAGGIPIPENMYKPYDLFNYLKRFADTRPRWEQAQ